MPRRLTFVTFNDRGRRIGDSHPRAKLSNREVELVLQLHAQGVPYSAIAGKFGVSKSCVALICRHERRGQAPALFRTVHVTRKG